MTARAFVLPCLLAALTLPAQQQSQTPAQQQSQTPAQQQSQTPAQQQSQTPAQQQTQRPAPQKAPAPPPPIRTLDLTHTEPIPSLAAPNVNGYPAVCSSDGTIFVQPFSSTTQQPGAHPAIFSISDTREVGIVTVSLPSDYNQVNIRSLFPTPQELVAVVQASQPTDPNVPVVKGRPTSFLSINPRDSADSRLLQLDLPFNVVRAALLSSGDFLVLGNDTVNQLPVLAMLGSDGTLKKMLDLDPRLYLQSKELAANATSRTSDTRTAQQKMVQRALSSARFVPFGDQVLLVQTGTTMPVLRFTSSGDPDPVTIKLPPGFVLDRILGSSDRDTWVLLATPPRPLARMTSSQDAEGSPNHLFEVDPITGEVIDELALTGTQNSNVACAAHQKLTALYTVRAASTDANTQQDQLSYASAPR